MQNKKTPKNNLIPNTVFGFLTYISQEHKLVIFAYLTIAFIAGFWGPFNSMLIKYTINLMSNMGDQPVSVLYLPLSLIVVNFIIFDNVTWRTIGYIRSKLIPALLIKTDNLLLSYTIQHSHQFFQENMSGKLARQIVQVIACVETIMFDSLPNIVRMFSLLLMACIGAFQVSPMFSAILIIYSIVFASISLYMSKKLMRLSGVQGQKESILGGEITDTLVNSLTVKLFGSSNSELNYRQGSISNYKIAYRKKVLYMVWMNIILGGLISIMFGCSLFWLLRLYSQRSITSGDFALIMGLCIETGHMMWSLMTSTVHKMNQGIGAASESLKTLLIPLQITDKPNAIELKCTKGEIVFDKVSFHYKNSDLIFRKKSIQIQHGQKVGLVGYSGGGKTTFVNLLLRLYDIKEGAILIDGQDIRDVTQESLRKNIAMIPQDPLLFNRSLLDNIRYGTNATTDEVIEAAKRAHAHEFIIQLPEKYDTVVGERGLTLSGGQRQRIAIARAALKNAPILILDEATSQLDSVTEHLIQESLLDIMNKKTTLVIAHRLSTLLHMDRILVFDKGQIVQDGSHSDLLAEPGLYKTLWDTQVGGFLVDYNI